MSAAFVQSVTGIGASLTLNSVVGANGLTLKDSYFRNPSTGLGEAVPTDTNGTWLVADTGGIQQLGGFDIGVSQFYLQNAPAGTHTVTVEANTGHGATLSEYAGLKTSGMLNDKQRGGNQGLGTSQDTFNTGNPSAVGDLAEIAFGMGATTTGSTDVGFTNPVAGYITLNINPNDATSEALIHAYQIVTVAGVKNGVFNWTLNEADQFWVANIVTYNAIPTPTGVMLDEDAGVALLSRGSY